MKEHIDSGQYSIYPTIIGQTTTNTIITEYKRAEQRMVIIWQ